MSYRILLVLNALVAIVFGAFFLILPQTALELFGTETYVPMLLVARFLGGAVLMTGILTWFLKDLIDQATQRNAGLALLAGSVGAFVLSLIGMSSNGIIRTNGWVLLVVSLIIAMGYVFLLFLQPRAVSAGGGYQKQV